MNRESLAEKFIEFPIGYIPGARADLAGLADNIVSQPLLFEVAGACMRTICLDADRLFVGDGTVYFCRPQVQVGSLAAPLASE